jgi:hypothetical protein
MGEWWYSSIFLTSALDGGEWSASHPCRFIPMEIASSTHCIGLWMGSRTRLNATEKETFLPLLGIEPQFLSHPLCSIAAIPSELSWFSCIYLQEVMFVCMSHAS